MGGFTKRGILRSFGRDKRGNVAMMWGLMGTALVGLVGLTVDFTRAQMLRTQLQNAADGAVLVAERSAALSPTDREAAAQAYFAAEMGDLAPQATMTLAALDGGGHRADAYMPMDVSLAGLIRNEPWTVHVSSEAERGGVHIEVAMALDTTGSMGWAMADLRAAATDLVNIVVRDEQAPFTSRVALAPYSNSVNVGGLAAQARGAITPGRNMTNATWANSPARNITGATRANPVVITSNGHGFNNGDRVWIRNVNGMTQINNRVFTVANRTGNTFQLQGVNGSGYNNYSSNGTVTRCEATNCEVVVEANNHGFNTNDFVFISGVNGMTQINSAANTAWQVTRMSADKFSLNTSVGPNYNAYTSSGTAFCTLQGCEYFRFNNANNGAVRVFRVSTCVSERTGAERYTDAAPTTAFVGLVYPSAGNGCTSAQVMPLTDDRNALIARINSMNAGGSTAGHIGQAWAWYLLAPNFSYMYPGASTPRGYTNSETVKIAVLMTDGFYNTPYCNGVIARDAGAGSGSAADHINCDAPNGDPFTQADNLCDAMKDRSIVIYTVAFSDDNDVRQNLRDCATTPGHAFTADDTDELREAFRAIGENIALLRLTR